MLSAFLIAMFVGAAPAPHGEVLLEGDHLGVMLPEVRVSADGAWERGDGVSGRLDEGARRTLGRLVAVLGRPKPLPPQPLDRTAGCGASFMRLGAGGQTWSWNEGCGDYPTLEVERLLHFLRRQTHGASPPFGFAGTLAIVRDGRALDPARGGPTGELVVHLDGTWSERGPAPEGAVIATGRIGAAELGRLRELAAGAAPAFDPGAGRCRAIPTAWHHLLVPGVADVVWRTPCGPSPGAAVLDFVQALRSAVAATRGGLAPERPGRFMLALRTGPMPMLPKASFDETVILPDGTWHKPDGTSGRLDARDLAELRDAIARTRVEMEAPDPTRAICAAIPTTTFELETGDGRTVRWAGPCAPGPHPTVGELWSLVSRLL